ncbi:hypothetical protein CYMTET_33787, partial [Cymbomonas tetramitiformis]
DRSMGSLLEALPVALRVRGSYRPCNRLGMESSTSPFLKMSYETATHFLTDATLQGASDELTSPSSRIVLGRVVEMGTGAVQLLQTFGEPNSEPKTP